MSALDAARPVIHRPRWLIPASLTLSVLGLLVSAYLTYEHYTGSTSLVCSESQTVNCQKVTTSPWATFLGLPVALLGLLFFVAMTILCLPVVWRLGSRALDRLRVAATVVGAVMVLYLIWAELVKIRAICLWCTGVHVISFLLFLVVAVGAILSYEE